MPTTMESEIEDLRRMTTDKLADRYEELHHHPSRVRLIFNSKRKNDRIDAANVSQRLNNGLLIDGTCPM